MESTVLFSKTPPLKLFAIAAIPGSVSMLASALYQLLDGAFVGRLLGETAFAALNLAMPFVIINFALADLIGVGSSVHISVCLGRKNEREAYNIFTCACLMIIGTGVLVGGILFAAAPLLIGFMGAEGDFAAMAIQYMRVYALCSPVTTIIFAVDNFLRICGYVRGSMFLNILMSALCAILEFLFLGVFRWGIWAAALATCSAMMICAVIAFIPFFRKKALLRFCRPKFQVKMIRQIITCGSPNFLNNIAGRITSILMNVLLVRLGGEIASKDVSTVLGVSRPSVHRMLENLGNSGLTEKKPYGAVKLTEAGLHLVEELEARRDRLLLLFARRFGLSMDESALAATLLLSGLNEESLALLEAASQTP